MIIALLCLTPIFVGAVLAFYLDAKERDNDQDLM